MLLHTRMTVTLPHGHATPWVMPTTDGTDGDILVTLVVIDMGEVHGLPIGADHHILDLVSLLFLLSLLAHLFSPM